MAAIAVALGVAAFPAVGGAANPWIRIPAPSPSPTSQQLSAVDCVSLTECTAIGFYVADGRSRTLVTRTTDGTTWNRIPSPSPGTLVNLPYDIDCVSATQCTAVGWYASTTRDGEPLQRTFVMRTTDGLTWQRTPTPNPFDFSSALQGVSCTSALRCRAVGNFGGNSMVLRTGDGINWFREDLPMRGTGANYPTAIDCYNNLVCMIVGFFYPVPNDTAHPRTLVLRTSTGHDWGPVNSPNPAPTLAGTYLNDVSCTGIGVCYAVGSVEPTPTLQARGFALRTSDFGVTWRRGDTPDAAGEVDLLGVDCPATLTCTAVGYAWNTTHDRFSTVLLRTGSGTKWVSRTPASERLGRGVGSVSCVVVDKCVAVGTYNATGDFDDPVKNLILKET